MRCDVIELVINQVRILDYISINDENEFGVSLTDIHIIYYCECKCRLTNLICYIEKIIESLSTLLNECITRFSHHHEYDIPGEWAEGGTRNTCNPLRVINNRIPRQVVPIITRPDKPGTRY